jgi:hypothetical protein
MEWKMKGIANGLSEHCCNSIQKVSQSKWRFRAYGTTGDEKLEEW